MTLRDCKDGDTVAIVGFIPGKRVRVQTESGTLRVRQPSVQRRGLSVNGKFAAYRFDAAADGIVEQLVEWYADRPSCVLDVIDALDDDREYCTLEEVGELLGVTRERARQIEERALKKLRAAGADGEFEDLKPEETTCPT